MSLDQSYVNKTSISHKSAGTPLSALTFEETLLRD